MVLALGCAHQLPRIGAPAIVSARLGTVPRPDSRTTPLALTKAMACFGVIHEFSCTFAAAASWMSALLCSLEPSLNFVAIRIGDVGVGEAGSELATTEQASSGAVGAASRAFSGRP